MRHIVAAGFVVLLSIGLRADTMLIPLVDRSDPVVITNSKVEFEDHLRPVMFLELENTTAFPIETGDVWLMSARFFTRTEVARAADSKVWDCGEGSTAAHDERSISIPPKSRVVIRHALTTSCSHTREHEHFFVHITRIGHRFSEPIWARPPQEFAQLLAAAQPHP